MVSVTVVMAWERLRGDGETKQGRRSVKSSAPCCSHGVNGGRRWTYGMLCASQAHREVATPDVSTSGRGAGLPARPDVEISIGFLCENGLAATSM